MASDACGEFKDASLEIVGRRVNGIGRELGEAAGEVLNRNIKEYGPKFCEELCEEIGGIIGKKAEEEIGKNLDGGFGKAAGEKFGKKVGFEEFWKYLGGKFDEKVGKEIFEKSKRDGSFSFEELGRQWGRQLGKQLGEKYGADIAERDWRQILGDAGEEIERDVKKLCNKLFSLQDQAKHEQMKLASSTEQPTNGALSYAAGVVAVASTERSNLLATSRA